MAPEPYDGRESGLDVPERSLFVEDWDTENYILLRLSDPDKREILENLHGHGGVMSLLFYRPSSIEGYLDWVCRREIHDTEAGKCWEKIRFYEERIPGLFWE